MSFKNVEMQCQVCGRPAMVPCERADCPVKDQFPENALLRRAHNAALIAAVNTERRLQGYSEVSTLQEVERVLVPLEIERKRRIIGAAIGAFTRFIADESR